MTEWQISIPFRDRSDPVAEIADAAGALPDREARDVVRALTLELATTSGIETVADALDVIDNATPAARRALLDRARERAGLRSTAAEEGRREFERANSNLGASSSPTRDNQGRVQALCSHKGCPRFLPGAFPGSIAFVEATRWWCDEHRHLAAAEDSEPYRPRLAYGLGGIVDLDEQAAEGERALVAAESRRRQYEARLAALKPAAAERERHRQAEHERLRRETPEGFWAP